MSQAFERVTAVIAAVVCVAYTSSLHDVPLRELAPEPQLNVSVLPPPAPSELRDGVVRVSLSDERGALVEGARVMVFAIRDDKALWAGSLSSDARGVATTTNLPRGETWILAESEGRQRSSTRLVLGGSPADVTLVLRRAEKLRVQAVDEELRAVAGVVIEVRGGDPLPYVAKTGPDGAAELTRLGPAPWSLEASAPGFEPVRKTGLGSGLLPQRVVMRALSTLTVSVVHPDGSPAAGASVDVTGSGLWPARTGTADEAGQLKIAGLPSGAYDVVASLGDQVSATSFGTPVKRGEQNAVKLVLGTGRRVLIRVVDGEGEGAKPVVGASVVLAEDGLSPFPKEAVTGSQGEALLGPVSSGQLSVSARAEGFVARTGVQVPASQEGPLVIALMRGGVLRGRVVDTHDYPIDGATIEVIGVDLAGMPVAETPENIGFRAAHFAWAISRPRALIPAGELGVMPGPIPPIPRGNSVVPPSLLQTGGAEPPPAPWVSEADGTFKAAPVPPGRLRALVRHPGYVETLSDAVSIGPGGEGSVRVVMRAGGTLEGRVFERGRVPVAGARVELAAIHGMQVRSVITAEDGTFAFAAVPGEVSLSVSRPDEYDVVLRKTISLGEGERKELELELPVARPPLTVRVVDDRGYPLDAVQISAQSLQRSTPLRETRFTRDDGIAQIPDAAGLPLRLEVTLIGHAPLVKVLESAGDKLELTLRPGSSVTGEITARGGRDALSGAELTLRSSQGLTRRVRSDAQGRYVIRDLAPGPAKLTVTHKGHARREVSISVPEADPGRPSELDRIDLAEAGSVEGEVRDRDGFPVVGARVAQGAVPAYLTLGALPEGIVVTDAHGRFTLVDLPEGEVAIEAYAPERGRGQARGVRVYADRVTRDVRITLDAEAAQTEPSSSGGLAVSLGDSDHKGRVSIIVLHVAPGSEAERAGLLEGDVLLRIDDEAPTSLEDARKRLSGPVSEDVVLRVRRGDEELPLRIARERVRR